MLVYLAWHTRVDSASEDSKLLGVYSSEAAAHAAINRVRAKSGFVDYPNGFEVSEYQVDRDSWVDGFGFDEPAA